MPDYIDTFGDVVVASAAIACSALALVIFFAWLRIPARLLRACAILGAASYPLYLLHQRAGYLLLDVAVDLGAADWLAFIAVTLCMVGVSIVIATVLEPALRRAILWRWSGALSWPAAGRRQSAVRPARRTS